MIDERPVLRLAQATWDREADPYRLVDEAAKMGLRLEVERPDGSTWQPESGPERW